MCNQSKDCSPEAFWAEYARQLMSIPGARHAYRNKPVDRWTAIAAHEAPNAAIRSLGHITDSGQYLHLDAAGWDRIPRVQDVWQLKIAFEHENASSWPYELCQLTDVVAELRVMIAYTTPNAPGDEGAWRSQVQGLIQTQVDRLHLAGRILRVPNVRWLLAFGPNRHHDMPFVPFTLDGDRVLPLGGNPLRVVPIHDLRH